jgi:hypothetical protein
MYNVTTGLLADVLAALPDNTPYTPHTIVFSSSLIINNNDTGFNGAWAVVKNTIKGAEKYVILDLSACSAVNNTISGGSDHNNTMNHIGGFVKGIIMPDSLAAIGDSAFSGCTGFTSITIPAGVTTIGERAFSDCTALASITIPAGVTTIGSYAFSDCAALTSITIPASVTYIREYAFGGWGRYYDSGCAVLTSVTFAEGSNIADEWAFGGSAFPQGSDGTGGNNLRMRYLTSSPKAGTYTRPAGGDTWTKQ